MTDDPRDAAPAEAQPRRDPPWVLIVGIVVLGLVAAGMGAILLTREPTTGVDLSPSPSASASATESPDGTASASLEPSTAATSPAGPSPSAYAAPAEVFPLGSVVRVTGDSLRIRDGAGLGSDTLGVAAAGDLVYIGSSSDPRLPPRLADGYEWYPVQYVPGYEGWPVEPDPEEQVGGYMATGNGTDSFVELEPPNCSVPADDLEAAVAMTPYERVACLGDRQLTFEGSFGCPYCDALTYPVRTEPDWLANWTLQLSILVPRWSDFPPFPGSIVVVTPPDVQSVYPELEGHRLRVTGHFSDPRSADCTITPEPPAPPDPVHPESAEWYCRERFVVDSWEDLGMDPDYEALVPS